MKRLLVGAVCIIALMPFLTSAVTIEELQIQINTLLSQIATLEAQQGTAAACPNLSRNLSRGSRGTDVTQLQQFLISQNYLAPDNATGFFGAMTEGAVKAFQCTNMNICSGSPSVNGYGSVGPKTRVAIGAACKATQTISVSPPTTPTPPASAPTPTPTSMPTPLAAPTPTPGVPPVTPIPESTPASTTTPQTPVPLPMHNAAQISPPAPARILISPLLESQGTTAFNKAWATLPKRFADIPKDANGNPNYYFGSVSTLSQGYAYGNGAAASSNAFVILPPGADNDLIKVYFGGIPNLSTGTNWVLKFKAGLQGDAPPGTKAQLRIGAAADKLHANDAPWTYFGAQEVVAGQAYPLSLPLGSWPLRDNFILIFESEKVGPNNYYQAIAIDDVYLEATRAAPWNSLVRSNLPWDPIDKQNKVMDTLAKIPSDWHRDGVQDSAPAMVKQTVANYKRIQDQGKRMMINVMQHSEDYGWDLSKTRHAGAAFEARCGWKDGQFPLSTINLDTFEKRMAAYLRAMKDAGVRIEAFEIGNELDWVCFNGDLPFDRAANQAEVDTTVRAYAAFLEHSVRIIDQYYPNALIVSHGAAVSLPSPAGTIENPGRILATLQNLDGKNYMNLVDRIGVHGYVVPDDPAAAARLVSKYASDGGSSKPVWITEWGYTTSSFPTAQGRDRYTAFVDFYDAVTQVSQPVVQNIFYYALDDFGWGGHTLVDSNYNLLPETSKFFGKF